MILLIHLNSKEELDLLFLDIEMGETSGMDVKKYFEDNNINTRVAFLTNYSKMMKQAFGKNIYGFVDKSNYEAELLEIVDKILVEMGLSMLNVSSVDLVDLDYSFCICLIILLTIGIWLKITKKNVAHPEISNSNYVLAILLAIVMAGLLMCEITYLQNIGKRGSVVTMLTVISIVIINVIMIISLFISDISLKQYKERNLLMEKSLKSAVNNNLERQGSYMIKLFCTTFGCYTRQHNHYRFYNEDFFCHAALSSIRQDQQKKKFPIDYPFFGIDSSVSGVAYNISKALTVLGNDVELYLQWCQRKGWRYMAKMVVYHGSYTMIKEPRVKSGKYTKDFGDGFYCTIIKEQAEKWARRYDTPMVNVYEIQINNSLTILEFKEMTEEWLDFVIDCRSGKEHNYDIVIGAMANDQIYNFVSDYMDGIITREQFWVMTKFKYPTHQMNLCTEEAIKCLEYRDCQEVIR